MCWYFFGHGELLRRRTAGSVWVLIRFFRRLCWCRLRFLHSSLELTLEFFRVFRRFESVKINVLNQFSNLENIVPVNILKDSILAFRFFGTLTCKWKVRLWGHHCSRWLWRRAHVDLCRTSCIWCPCLVWWGSWRTRSGFVLSAWRHERRPTSGSRQKI